MAAMLLGCGDHEASVHSDDIVAAAGAGRIERISASSAISLLPSEHDYERSSDGPEDLIDCAIVESLRNSGEVLLLEVRGG